MGQVDPNKASSVASVADEMLVAALVAGKTPRDAAELAGVCETHVARRLRDEAFAAAVVIRRSGYAKIEPLLESVSPTGIRNGIDVLHLLAGEARLAAARLILDVAVRWLHGAALKKTVNELSPFLFPSGAADTSADAGNSEER